MISIPPPYTLDDHTAISFTSTESSYIVGTDNETGNFFAEETLFIPTQDVYIRFNTETAVQHYLLANTAYTFKRKISIIYVQRVSADGTLYCHFEGGTLQSP